MSRSIGTDRRWFALGVVEFEVGADDAPLDALEESFDVGVLVGPVLSEVGVLPEIATHYWRALHVHNAVHKGVVLVVRLRDQQPTILTSGEPDPARKDA